MTRRHLNVAAATIAVRGLAITFAPSARADARSTVTVNPVDL
jgi:hypothetical protein